MTLGIVGSEAAKFTPETEVKAREAIGALFALYKPTLVVSGECHLGGVDIFAREEAENAGIRFRGHPPKKLQWDGGYKQRNMKIAEDSTLVVCITVAALPSSYAGMRFAMCYHCGTTSHQKSGGCWTVKYAKKIGKQGEVIVI